MALGQYFWVYFNPNGRLPRELYWFYGVPVAAAMIMLRIHMSTALEKEEPLSIWLLPLLVTLIWMNGCVMSRRLRDAGISGALSVAIAVVLMIDAVCIFFPGLLGDTDDIKESSSLVIGMLLLAARWMFRFTCAACVAKEGFSGANQYGPPLGTLNAKEQANRDVRRRERIKGEAAAIVAGQQDRKAARSAQTEPTAQPVPRSAHVSGAQRGVPVRQARQGFGRR